MPAASQPEDPDSEDPDVTAPVVADEPVRPVPPDRPVRFDRDLGLVTNEGELAADHELIRDLPEPKVLGFESGFDLSRLSGLAAERTETVRLDVVGLGVVVAVFEPLVDPLDLAPWPIQRFDPPAQRSPLRAIATERAWLDSVPVRVVLTEPTDGSEPPTLYVTELGRVTVIGPCQPGKPDRAGDGRACVVSREARQLQPDAIVGEPGDEGRGERVDPDPFIGIEIVDPVPGDGFASSSGQHGGIDPDIDVLVVRVDSADDSGIAAEMADVQTGSQIQGLNFRYQVVGTMSVDWPGAGNTNALTILNWATNPADGVWDNIAATRNQVAADLVLVVVRSNLQASSGGSITGAALYPPALVWSGTRDTDFVAVVRSTNSIGENRDPADLAVAHEFGHVFGMRHDWCDNEVVTTAHGFVMPSIGADLRTIMAGTDSNRGPTCNQTTMFDVRVPRWSTLDGDTYTEAILTFPYANNVPLGIVDARSDIVGNQSTDNEARFEIDAWDVARYRVADVCPFGTSGFASGGLASAPARLVAQQYWDILGRAPDSNGLAYWESLLVNGEITGSDTIMNFVRGPEFEGTFGEVIRMYQMMQGRIADVGGLNYWSVTNTNRQALAGALMTVGSTNWAAMSDAQFVGNVWLRSHGFYLEHSWWIGQIANGNWSRPQMLAYFNGLGGARNYWLDTTDASMIYYGMLDRAPDAGGLAFWSGLLSSGTPYVDVITGFRGSAEYRNRVGVGAGC